MPGSSFRPCLPLSFTVLSFCVAQVSGVHRSTKHVTHLIALFLVVSIETGNYNRVAFNEFNGHGGTVKSVDTFFFTADMFFTVVFTVELLMRLVALEMTFFLSPEGRWNFVDFVLVIISIAEAALAGTVCLAQTTHRYTCVQRKRGVCQAIDAAMCTLLRQEFGV